MSNDSINKAKVEKNDEFYTLFEDIEKELVHYKNYFKNKVVYCNCDDPYKSNFFKYFVLNFDSLGLKRLICTCYAETQYKVDLFGTLNTCTTLSKYPYKAELNSSIKDYDGDGIVTLNDIELYLNDKNNHDITLLKGNGDFRSKECVELLIKSDIVVTNPPFSLFREYVSQLMEYGKKFLIIGSQNAITYKEFFPLLKENKVWLGYSPSKTMVFRVPNGYRYDEKITAKMDDGFHYGKGPVISWFTNLGIPKRHAPLDLRGNYYDPEKYPKYDNFDAIDVSNVADIPFDYDGYMGVPYVFLDRYCPEQFEIIGMGKGDTAKEIGVTKNYRGRTDLSVTVNGKTSYPYTRIIIKRKEQPAS